MWLETIMHSLLKDNTLVILFFLLWLTHLSPFWNILINLQICYHFSQYLKLPSFCWIQRLLMLYRETHEQSKSNSARQFLFALRIHSNPKWSSKYANTGCSLFSYSSTGGVCVFPILAGVWPHSLLEEPTLKNQYKKVGGWECRVECEGWSLLLQVIRFWECSSCLCININFMICIKILQGGRDL